MSQVGVDIAATRARIYDDRNHYGVPGQPPPGNPATQPATQPAGKDARPPESK